MKRKLSKRQAQALQKKSMASRINRYISSVLWRNPKVVTQEPFRKRNSDAGYDIAASEPCLLQPGDSTFVRTGLHCVCPEGYFFKLESRSSLLAEGVMVTGSVIDATYTGEILVQLYNFGKQVYSVDVNDRIAQLVFYPQIHCSFESVDEQPTNTGRGDDGFGSSGV